MKHMRIWLAKPLKVNDTYFHPYHRENYTVLLCEPTGRRRGGHDGTHYEYALKLKGRAGHVKINY